MGFSVGGRLMEAGQKAVVQLAHAGLRRRKEPALMVRKLLGPMLMTCGAAIQAGLMRSHYKILQTAGKPIMQEHSIGHP